MRLLRFRFVQLMRRRVRRRLFRSSRFLSLRRATIGLVAMRVWVLDASLKYTVQVERQKKDKHAPKPVAQVEDAYSRKFGISYIDPDEDEY